MAHPPVNTPSSSDIHPGPGFRIRLDPERPDPAVVEGLASFETPDVCDLTNRLYAMGHGIANLVNKTTICGPACTVKVYPGDNLMVHKALSVAKPGDVLVIDTCGASTNAVVGDMIATKAKHLEITGIVIDGLIRDIEGCREVGLPIFAKGTTPAGPLHRGPGEINYPVSCGGVVVSAGDIVIGDEMGVAVVPRSFAGDVLARLERRAQDAAEYQARVRSGDFSLAWVDDALAKAGGVMES